MTIFATLLLAVVTATSSGGEGENLDELGMVPRIWLTFDGDWTSRGTDVPEWDVKARGTFDAADSREGAKHAMRIGPKSHPGIWGTKLVEEYTVITTARCGTNPKSLIWAFGSARGRGARAVGLGYDGKGGVKVATWWSASPSSKLEAMKPVVNFDKEFHQFALVAHPGRVAEFYVDGKLAGKTDSYDGANPGWELYFGGLHWAGAGGYGGFDPGDGVEVDDFRVYDQALTELQVLQISNSNRPWPEGIPQPKHAISAFVDTNSVLRFGYEIPENITIGKDGEKRLVAKGILAQCGIGGAKSLTLGEGGAMAIGEKGFVFDSNYAGGTTNLITLSGGVLAAYEKSFIKSAAPIRLTGNVKVIVKDSLVIRASIEGDGNLIKSGSGILALQYPCENATGKIIVRDGEVAMGPSGSWGGTITPKAKAPPLQGKKFSADAFPQPATAYKLKSMQREKLGRGVFAWRSTPDETRITWRYKSSDPTNLAFNVYCNGRKLNAQPIADITYFVDKSTKPTVVRNYQVKGVMDGREYAFKRGANFVLAANSPIGYLEIPLTPPKPELPPGAKEALEYSPNDCSIGDLDGDGEYELVIKWQSITADNAFWYCTAPTWFEAVKLDGTARSLWKICLGPNVRAGAHYSPFLVYDFDGDGVSELIVRTADGTMDAKGRVLNGGEWSVANKSRVKDWRKEDCHLVFAPNYLTVFSGLTGEALDTVPYRPAVLDDAQAIEKKDWRLVNRVWGSRNPGNQAFRFLAAVAYLDGKHPSAVFCRGYYSKSCLVAWDFVDGKLKERWFFNSEEPEHWGYGGQGYHNIRVADVDFDGKDEILYGHMCVDHTGRGLWTTGYGHGDSMRLMQCSPEQRGLALWTCHECRPHGVSLIDAQSGRTILRRHGPQDTGSCNAADTDPREPGLELFSGTHCGIYSSKTLQQYMWPKPRPRSNYYAMLRHNIWWMGDLTKSAWCGDNSVVRYGVRERCIFEQWAARDDVACNNGSKGDPCLIADIFGDWREEIVVRRRDNKAIRLFSSPIDTQYRFHTFLEDPVYRISVATENAGYNIPTDTGFYFGPDLLGHNILFRGCHLNAPKPQH